MLSAVNFSTVFLIPQIFDEQHELVPVVHSKLIPVQTWSLRFLARLHGDTVGDRGPGDARDLVTGADAIACEAVIDRPHGQSQVREPLVTKGEKAGALVVGFEEDVPLARLGIGMALGIVLALASQYV